MVVTAQVRDKFLFHFKASMNFIFGIQAMTGWYGFHHFKQDSISLDVWVLGLEAWVLGSNGEEKKITFFLRP
jgi:hypothetical protein